MYKLKKRKKIKSYLIIIAIFIVFLMIVYWSSYRQTNFNLLEKITHDIGSSIGSIFIPKAVEVNEEILTGIYNQLENEVNELKKMQNLKIENYKFIHANVIKRENWYQELIINKGENDGIRVNMAVVANDRLIGKIVKTTFNTSYISLISSNNMKIAVLVNGEDEQYYGILDGYLNKDDYVLVNIKKNSNVKEGNKVYTSGLGGIYPKGIYIGEINEIVYDSLGLEMKLKIKINATNNISYVTVIDRS